MMMMLMMMITASRYSNSLSIVSVVLMLALL